MVDISFVWMQTFELYFSMWCLESGISWEEAHACKNCSEYIQTSRQTEQKSG